MIRKVRRQEGGSGNRTESTRREEKETIGKKEEGRRKEISEKSKGHEKK